MSRIRCAARLAAALASLILTPSAAALSNSPDDAPWITDGPVYALAHAGGTTYIGGDFSHVGKRIGAGAPFYASGGQAGTTVAPVAEVAGGTVKAAVSDGGGGWYIGGDFTYVKGLAVGGLAHIGPDGVPYQNLTPHFSCLAGSATCSAPSVNTLAYSTSGPDAGTLYVGGEFEKVGSTGRKNLAAFNSQGSLLSWNPEAAGTVDALATTELQLDTTVPVVFAGGSFSHTGSQANPNIAAIWGVGAVDQNGSSIAGTSLSWHPFISTTIRSVTVSPQSPPDASSKVALAVYIGGDSSASQGLLEAIPFKLPATGSRSVDSAFNPYSYWDPAVACPSGPLSGDTCQVRALWLRGGTLYIAGSFTSAGQSPVTRRGVAALAAIAHPELDTNPANPATPFAWNPDADGTVSGLAGDGTNLYLAGRFSTLSGASAGKLAALAAPADATTAAGPPVWDAGLAGGDADAVAVGSGGEVYAGGSFNANSAVARSDLAAIGADGAPTAWAPNADGPVHALALSNGVLYAGGGFTHVGGQPRAHVAALDASGAALPWQADTDGWVLALGVAGQTIYAGGAFGSVKGASRSNVAAITTSGDVLPWDPGANDAVRAVAASCGLVYLGGSFTTAGGAARNRVAAVDPATGAASGWDPNSNSVVYALAPAGDSVYTAGAFTSIGNASRLGLAALAAQGGTATAWNPSAASPSIARALAISGDGTTIYAGGSFRTMDGLPRDRVAAIDATSAAVGAWAPSMDAPVYALAASGDNLYLGGDFMQVGPSPQQGFASFTGGSDAGALAQLPCPQDTPAAQSVPAPPLEPLSAASTSAYEVLGTRSAADTLAPAIRRFAIVPRRIRSGRPAKFRFISSEGGAALIKIERQLPRSRKKVAGRLRRTIRPGAVSIRLPGQLGRHALAPGKYRATLVVTDAAGNKSAPKRTAFEVVGSGRATVARSAGACPDADLQPYPGNLDRVGKAIVCEINERRVEAGLVPLRQQRQLDQSSQFQSDDMVESRFVAHNEPGHPSLLTRIRRTGYFKGVAGGLYTENIAVAPQDEATAVQVVAAWILSDEHRAKILFGRFREIGVGARITGPDPVFYADRPSVVYTTDFARRYWRRCGFRPAGASAAASRTCTRHRRPR